MTSPHTRFGTMLAELSSPNAAVLFARAGFDFLIVDGEHGPFNRETVAGIIAGAPAVVDVYVRVPGVERTAITAFLDMGAAGIVVPMVSTVEEAQQVAAYSKYGPVGRRGVSTVRAHTGYGVQNLNDYQSAANAATRTYVQIETLAGLEAADKIAAVDGIDGLILGPSDLRADASFQGVDPDVVADEAIGRVASAAAAAGKESGVIATSPSFLGAGARAGMTFFGVGSELHFVLRGAGSLLTDVKAACQTG
ncbi:hypothetical protein CH254_24215 [Rhodococcus sp. 06-412-2C]|uniref:HpcH/HpaI aldolase family protein n=1 Tax=unclassified Rhodococcus (in: high G+C Gram-positive bacteria) TaxID=192944 RepID=UPI000B9BBE5C|nr:MULTISPECIES: aldolase/citrate lyase family protein [unclassified Rhodococcus (in: high G+C Gram-positive bacteria)]OZC83990.1 hypothetical protein CH254_24215 [Rhodococcus sp. 06-412-2C]OZC94176.1 hypothetical protein CH279_22300 [Rhodococcus sp. 06-412-2B]